MAAVNRRWQGTCLSSPPSSSGESSTASQEGSPVDSRPASPRGSHSYDTLNTSPARHPSPPPGWCRSPGVVSPTHSVPEFLCAGGTGGGASPVSRWALASAAMPATGPARAKSPFWVTSVDSACGQQQSKQHIQLAAAGAGEAQQMERDRDSVTTDDHDVTDSSLVM
ncbi:uncharacterized protein [Dermacentor albipictus]|uniref:uncharacterized protein n=1 Tax=Dermacentor albipictus TaxID=60249 RepID=UPI0038FC5523